MINFMQIMQKSILYIKKLIKKLIRYLIFGDVKPILIASTGRAGSTLMVNVVSQAYISKFCKGKPKWFKSLAAKYSCSYINRLCAKDIKLANSPVLKTHDLYTNDSNICGKKIFLFSDPLESALSVSEQIKKNGDSWGKRHINHLKGSGQINQILNRDVLNYKNQLLSWGESDAFIIHYDDLWSRSLELSKYLELDIVLPEKKERCKKDRTVDYNKNLFDSLQNLGDIYRKINS